MKTAQTTRCPAYFFCRAAAVAWAAPMYGGVGVKSAHIPKSYIEYQVVLSYIFI